MRIYDVELDCGCMYSADGGGGLMPCCYDDSDPVQSKKCDEAHEKWYASESYKHHCEEVQRRNQ